MTPAEMIRANVAEEHALELDREALCSLCRHRGRFHVSEGCGVPSCSCRVPLRLVRCVVAVPRPVRDDDHYGMTDAGWRALDELVDEEARRLARQREARPFA